MDLQRIKQTIKDDSIDDVCALTIRAGKHERAEIFVEAIDLIDRAQGIFSKITDPAAQRHISFENWSILMRIDMEMAQFIRKLRV